MSQWFDIWSVEDPDERKDLQIDGLRKSINFIQDIIRSETSLVCPDHIILAGISQGCATAILTLLSGNIRLAGFIGLSSWLPFREEILGIARGSSSHSELPLGIRTLFNPPFEDSSPQSEMAHRAQSGLGTPAFLAHCEDEDVVPIFHGERLRQGLEEFDMTLTWGAYKDGGHWINEPQGVDDIVAFIQRSMFSNRILGESI
ncbi:MAG: hypothetical protein M1818_003101 [Claussenomyces sp. TS43310]|nr:MAG: hypothetical protein M1818_003101 [Claussenomyces sp. TS43310]